MIQTEKAKVINNIIGIARIYSCFGHACVALSLIIATSSFANDGSEDEGERTPSAVASAEFMMMAKQHAILIIRRAPEWSTQLGLDESIGGRAYSRKLSDYSVSANTSAYDLNRRLLSELETVDRTKLDQAAAVTYDILLNAYSLAERQNRHRIGTASLLGASAPYAINQLFGPQIDLPRLFVSQHVVATADDVSDFLERLQHFDSALDGLGEAVLFDAERGFVPPKFVLEAVAKSARQFTSEPPATHVIVTSFATQLESNGTVTPAAKVEAIESATNVIARQVYPAYRRLADLVESVIPMAGEDAGLWRVKGGDQLYQIALDNYGASGLTAEEIYQIGLQDVSRIEDEMDAVLRRLGYKVGAVGERLVAIANEPGGMAPNTSEGKSDLLQDLREYVSEVMQVAPRWFGTIPPQDLHVQRIPSYEEDSAPPAYYLPPPLDGSRPGVFYINLKDTRDWPLFQLKTLVYHEAVPGHHFQAGLQQLGKETPLIRNMMYFSEYGEGWALYAEALAVEMGLYDKDPLGNIGRLKLELYRAARLVVDTGLHHKRWTRDEAVEWMTSTTGGSRSSIEREVERYAVWPGQATSYKLGMIRLQRLRKTAEQDLGTAFDIREFHDQILLDGSMPMPVLEQKIESWITSKLELANTGD